MKPRSIGRREFLIGAGGLAAAAAYIFTEGSERQVQLTPFHHLINGGPLQILIIGSGPAGAILAHDLAELGIRSAILESGPPSGSNGQGGQIDAYVNSGPVEYPIRGSKIRGLGGTSSIWTGRCSRFHPIDFEQNAYTPEGAEWPFNYAELEPYYDRAERSLRVRGGRLSEYHAPRSSDLPFAYSRGISNLVFMLGEVGVLVERSPTSQASLLEREALRASRDILPDYSTSDFGSVTSGVTATHLIGGKDGEVAGVRVKDYDGYEGVIEADIVILACGAIENARLLLLSHADGELNALGNSADLVGRGFMEHPHINFNGKLVQNHVSHFELGRSMQFYDELKQRGLGSIDLVFYMSPDSQFLRIAATIEMKSAQSNGLSLTNQNVDLFGNAGAELTLKFSEKDHLTMQEARKLIGGIFQDLGITEYEEIGQTWGHHHMGTCRMGADPETSVVDPDLRVHGFRNLHVLGSSAFVTGGAAHPTLLIAALAHRLSNHLAISFASRLARSPAAAFQEPIAL